MGLDVSHDCWHGGYSSFNIFREWLAKAAGIPLDLMEGYYRTESWSGKTYTYQPIQSMPLDELRARPDLAAKVTDWDALRTYDSVYVDRDRTTTVTKYVVTKYVEYPDPFVGPIYGVDPNVMEWLRARGPDGPLCHDSKGPMAYDWIVKTAQWLPLKWDAFKNDPIVTLLDHSDCDGDIRGVKVQRALADRLEELIPLLPEADAAGGGHLRANGGPKGAAAQFAKGLREAAAKRQVVRFG